MSTPLLEARGISRRFAARRRGEGEVVAVDAVDLRIGPGEVVGLVGESGSGKTTLGKLLLRILEPDEGELYFDGTDLRALDDRALRGLRGRFQMIYQSATAALNPGMSVEQHLRETIQLHRPADLDRSSQLIEKTLADYGLTGRGRARPSQLSGGEIRRVCIARCLLPEPELVVADEPTAGLDAAIKLEVLELMQASRTGSMSYLFISHDLDVVRSIADRVLVMEEGRVVQEMAARDLDPGIEDGVPLHPCTDRLLNSSFGATP